VAQKNSVRVIGADFSIGRLQNDEDDFQTCLMVGLQVAFFITDDGATNFYNSLGEALADKVIHLADARAIPKPETRAIPKGR
jgi:hypothetical protein